MPPESPVHHPIRTIVRGAYDIQKLRIQTGNRIVAQFKAKLGQRPGHTEAEDIDEEGQEVLKDLRAEFSKMMDGVKSVKLATFKASPLISSFTEFSLLQQYFDLEQTEKQHFKNLEKILAEYPVFTEFLDKITGIGPAIAGVIVSEIDIRAAKYASSLWSYAGLGVETDGRGTSRRQEHLHDVAYTDKEGNPQTRKGIRFNPFLKTKLVGVLGASFLRCANSPYRQIYLNYKNRLQNRPDWADKTKGHIHAAAIRYMIKIFLIHLYEAWKDIEGLPRLQPYSEGKLKMAAHGAAPSSPETLGNVG